METSFVCRVLTAVLLRLTLRNHFIGTKDRLNCQLRASLVDELASIVLTRINVLLAQLEALVLSEFLLEAAV